MLRQVVGHYNYSLASLRRTYGALLGCSQSVPLPLTANLVLVPLKMRRPHFDQDGATGYINACAVRAVESLPPLNRLETSSESPEPKCLVLLEGGSKLPGLYSKVNTEKRLVNARLALAHYSTLHGRKNEGKSAPVFERASADALDKVATASRILYELLVDRPDYNLACESSDHEY